MANDVSIRRLVKYNLMSYGPVVRLRSFDGTEKITITDSNKNGMFDKNDAVVCSQKGERKKLNGKEVEALLRRMSPSDRKYVGKLFSVTRIPNPRLSTYTVKQTMFSPDFKGTTVELERSEGLYSVYLQIGDINYNGVLDKNDSVFYRRLCYGGIEGRYLSKEDKRAFIRAMSKKDKRVIDSRFMRTVKRGWWAYKMPPVPRIHTGSYCMPSCFGIKFRAGPEYVSSWSKENGNGMTQKNGVAANVGLGLSVVLPHPIHSILDLESGTSIGAMIKRRDNGGTSSRTEFKPHVGLNLNVRLKEWLYKALVVLFVKGGYQASVLENDQGSYDTQHGFYTGLGVQLGFIDIVRYFNPQLGVTYSNFPSQKELKTRHDLSIGVTFSH